MASYQTVGADVIPSFLVTTPWQVKLAKVMFDETGDTALKSFFGAQGWNTGLINKLNKLMTAPILSGANRHLYMRANAGVSDAVVDSFLAHISEYEGRDVDEGPFAALDRLLESITKGSEGIGGTAKAFPVVLLILAAGTAGYLILAGKKGTKLTPF